MAKLLYRLGFWSAKNRIKVLLGSITLLVAAAIVALSMGIHFGEDLHSRTCLAKNTGGYGEGISKPAG